MIGGLKQKSFDPRDFKIGAVFDLPRVEDLPEEYVVGLPRILYQGEGTDFCTATAGASTVELHEGIPLAWQWIFAVGKTLEGEDVDSFGLELRTIAKVLVKYGIPEEKDIPPEFASKPSEFLRRIENWPPNLYDSALRHRQGSFFDISGVYDSFDCIRASIWKFAKENNAVMIGVLWGWSLSQITMETNGQGQYGHALTALGWKTINGQPYIYIQNSYGNEAGEQGRHYFSREVINTNVRLYGSIMFHDMEKEDALQIIKDREILQFSLFKRILIYLKKYIAQIFK